MNPVVSSNIGKEFLVDKISIDKKIIPQNITSISNIEHVNNDILPEDKSSIVDKKTFSFTKKDLSFQISKNTEIKSTQLSKGFQPVQLAKGISYTEQNNPKGDIRIVSVAPAQLGKIGVLFKRDGERIDIDKEFKSGKYLVVTNGTFFGGSFPAGDMKGTELGKVVTNDYKKKPQTKGLITDGEDRIAKNSNSKIHYGKISISDANKRYTFAISKDGKASIFQGGLETTKHENYSVHDQNKYNMALGSGFLLFDAQHNDVKKANDPELLLNIESNPNFERTTPRSAVGIKPDGSILLVQFGEGADRKIKGFTINNVVDHMKSLGCSSAVMFDGGGAPTIKAMDSNGKGIVDTKPYNKPDDSYKSNMSLIVISK